MNTILKCDSRIQKKNLNEVLPPPIICYLNSITDESAKDFTLDMAAAHEREQDFVPIVINSNGGLTYAMWSIIDVMQSSKIPIVTIIEGRAFSAGAMIAAMGNIGSRYMSTNSFMCLHEISASQTESKPTQMINFSTHLIEENKKMFEIIAKHCGVEKDFFTNKVKENPEWYLTAEEAKEVRLIDHIGIPDLEISIEVKYGIKL